MFKTIAMLVVAATLTMLVGCAGKDFVRPNPTELKIGRSTYADIVAMMGAPGGAGEQSKNGEKIKVVVYSYANLNGEPSQYGVTPARGMAYYFHNDSLVGHEFASSFKSDSTDFDETKVALIEKGKTSRSDVIAILGRPSGLAAKPLVRETAGEAISYSYATISGSPYTGYKRHRKVLRITFSGDDKVMDVDYTTSGSDQK